MFNPAKVPCWTKTIKELVWKIVILVIKNRMSVNALIKMYEVSEIPLQTLVTAIKEFLAINMERAKLLQERTGPLAPCNPRHYA